MDDIIILNINEICRTCMVSTTEEDLRSISEVKFGDDLLTEFLQKFHINLISNDEFPLNICNTCVTQIDQFYAFIQKCKSKEDEFQSMINSKKEETLIIKFEDEGVAENNETDQSSVTQEQENVTIRPVRAVESGPPYECTVCNKSFRHFYEIKRHRTKEKHPMRYKYLCPVCDDGKLYSYQCCVVHLRTHRDEKPYKCEYCDKGFKTNFNKKQHLRTHTGERPHVCESCGKGFAVLLSLKKHICPTVQTERIYTCKFCSNNFDNYTLYLRHLRQHKDDSNIEYHKCDQCDKKFWNKKVLATHKAVHWEKRFLCNTCGEEFHYKGSLTLHLRTHESDKKHVCDLCGKSFGLQSILILHKRVHTGERPYGCDLCGKRFKQPAHLRTHQKIHDGEKKFECSYCGKKFLLKGTLTVHLRTHTGDTPYVCDVCNRGFYDSTSMKNHKKRHRL